MGQGGVTVARCWELDSGESSRGPVDPLRSQVRPLSSCRSPRSWRSSMRTRTRKRPTAAGGGGDRYPVARGEDLGLVFALAKVSDVDAERYPARGGRLRLVGAVTRRKEGRAALAAGLSVLGVRGPPSAA
jgi:hypothetical protein